MSTRNYYSVGDRLPHLRRRVISMETGVPKNLTSATVTFTMVSSNSTKVIDAQDGVLEDGPNGLISYQWADGDLDNAGEFDAQFTVNGGTENEFHVPENGYIKIVVQEAL